MYLIFLVLVSCNSQNNEINNQEIPNQTNQDLVKKMENRIDSFVLFLFDDTTTYHKGNNEEINELFSYFKYEQSKKRNITKFELLSDSFYNEKKIKCSFINYDVSIFMKNKIDPFIGCYILNKGRLLINKKDSISLLFTSEFDNISSKIINNISCIYILNKDLFPRAAIKTTLKRDSLILEFYDSYSYNRNDNSLKGRKYVLNFIT